MAVNSDGELHQHSLNNALTTAILREDAMEIRNILKIRSSDSPLHSPIGFLGNGHSQDCSILPIHLAAMHRRVHSLEILLHSGADPERRDRCGCTTLHLVIAHWPKTQRTRSTSHRKFESTMAAIERRAEACLRLLCRSGVNVDAPVEGEGGQTAMHLAVRYEALPAVGILASHGARVDAVDHSGLQPLHMAAGTLSADMAASLIRHGADVDAAARQSGCTALHLAVLASLSRAGRFPRADLSCVHELLARGAAPDARNKAGRTPLHEACQEGREDAVDLLLRYGADVNIPTSRGENCLFLLLGCTANLRRTSLLERVIGLTYPLTITDSQGALPRALLLPEHRALKDLLLQRCKQPLSLQEACRMHIRRHCGERCRLTLTHTLPEQLHRFVYSNCTRSLGISFPGTRQTSDNETAADVNTEGAYAFTGYT